MSLRVEKLKVSVGSFSLEVEALEVGRGEICAVMGKSGSGKSTLLLSVAGFLPLRSGKILWEGVEVQSLPPERRRMAMVFQEATLFPHLTVFQNVEYSLRVQKVANRESPTKKWLERLEIATLAERLPHQISGGQAQRVALARAFNSGFPVLLMDEPFSSLDQELKVEMRAVVKSLCQEAGVAAVMVTHDVDDAKSADRTVWVKDGRLLLG